MANDRLSEDALKHIKRKATTILTDTNDFSDEMYAALVGVMMRNVIFNNRNVRLMLEQLLPQDFQDFCCMVPDVCNQIAAEK